MNSAIVLSEVRAVSKDLSGSKLLPSFFYNKPQDVLAVVLAGAELGIGPMQSLRGMDVIQGKISMSSQLIGALIMSSPDCEYLTPVEFTDKKATYETKRKGSPAPVRMSYTFEEAKQAGLTGKDNYRKNPVAMLLARCQARIGRACYPDKCLGVYDRDSGELDDLKAETTPLADHVETVKSKLREAVAPKPAVEVVEGTVVEEKPTPEDPRLEFPPTTVGTFAAKIVNVQTAEQLRALLPDLKALSVGEQETLKPKFAARKAELLAKAGAQ